MIKVCVRTSWPGKPQVVLPTGSLVERVQGALPPCTCWWRCLWWAWLAPDYHGEACWRTTARADEVVAAVQHGGCVVQSCLTHA